MFDSVPPLATTLAAVPADDEWVTLSPEGEIDLGREEELARLVKRTWAGTGRNLLIDLKQVSFMDSSGLRWLVKTHQLVKEEGLGFAISIPEDGMIKQLLEITALDRLIPIRQN
jgi:anti-anti-sigma factor